MRSFNVMLEVTSRYDVGIDFDVADDEEISLDDLFFSVNEQLGKTEEAGRAVRPQQLPCFCPGPGVPGKSLSVPHVVVAATRVWPTSGGTELVSRDTWSGFRMIKEASE